MKNICSKESNANKCIIAECFVKRITLIFSSIVFVFSAIGVLFGNADMQIAALPCSMIMWTALFAFLMAVVGIICDLLKHFKVNTVILYSAHFLLSYAAFLAVYVFGNGASAYLGKSAVTNFAFKVIIMTLIFVGIYVIISAVKFAVKKIADGFANKNKVYESIYTDSESK